MLYSKIITCSLLLLSPLAQNKPENPFSIVRDNSPVVAYEMLIDRNSQGNFQSQQSTYFQALGTLYSFTGKYAEARYYFGKSDSITHQKRRVNFEQLEGNSSLNADTAIVQLAKNFNVIAFNEEHHIPMSRAIVCHYLPKLAKLGYKYLALEALDERDSLISKRGYPLHYKTGYYTDEPVFGLLIRQAIKLGYTLLPYEFDDPGKDREEMQAKNIRKRYSADKGKMVVLAGYGHIREAMQPRFMGSFLKEYLNEDILTIKLTGSADYTNQIETSFTQPVLYAYNADYGFDYQYFVPPSYKTNTLNNIPSWYVPLLGIPVREIDLKKEFPKTYESIIPPCLVRLTNILEGDGVPVYQYLVTDKKLQKIALPFPELVDYKLTIQMGKNEYSKIIAANRIKKYRLK